MGRARKRLTKGKIRERDMIKAKRKERLRNSVKHQKSKKKMKSERSFEVREMV